MQGQIILPIPMGLHSQRHQGPTACSYLVLLWAAAATVDMVPAAAAGLAVLAASHPPTARSTNYTVVALQNPMQLFDTAGVRMNVHDGDVRQWTPGGPYYYYGMCAFRPQCTILHSHPWTHGSGVRRVVLAAN